MKSWLALLISMLMVLPAVSAEDNKSELKFAAQEVSSGLFMLYGVGGFAGGNIGLSIGDDGVVMIDDAMPSSLDILQQAVKSVTNKPIDFLINTHVHGDHAGNNVAFDQLGAHIVAHENLRNHLITKGVQQDGKTVAAPKGMLPVITFSQSMTFHLNNQDAQLIHVANAHTDGDAVIWFRQANVIHTGDVFFNGMFPFIDLNSGGSIEGYIAAQKKILSIANEQTKIIPGHGPLATKADLAAALAMLEDARNIIANFIQQGISEDDIVSQNPLKKYHDKWNWGFITTEKMTRQLVKGLTK
jgi:glyoxylase-like metal-dependent hydrolase (beta-lactamase superfamily II)